MKGFEVCVDEGGDVAYNVSDDVWLHILNLVWVAAKNVVEDMIDERPVDIDGDILVVVVVGRR